MDIDAKLAQCNAIMMAACALESVRSAIKGSSKEVPTLDGVYSVEYTGPMSVDLFAIVKNSQTARVLRTVKSMLKAGGITASLVYGDE